MDPTLACGALGDAPAAVDAHAAIWAGALVPIVVPLDCLPPDRRARLLLGHEEVELAARVRAALDAGLEDAAWAEIAPLAQPLSAPPGLDIALSLWAARESARLKLPAARGSAVCAGELPPALADSTATALRDVQELLPLPWPRWTGPIVLVAEQAEIDGLPTTADMVARPALPLLRVTAESTRSRGPIARGICRLALALTGPPRDGWPPWLGRGLGALSAARAENELVSPARMQELRRSAGPAAIAAALTAREPDERLSLALCAPLLHPSVRAHFAALLDLLRHGAGSEGALRVAYGLTPQALVEER